MNIVTRRILIEVAISCNLTFCLWQYSCTNHIHYIANSPFFLLVR